MTKRALYIACHLVTLEVLMSLKYLQALLSYNSEILLNSGLTHSSTNTCWIHVTNVLTLNKMCK